MVQTTIAHTETQTKHRSRRASTRYERGMVIFRADSEGIVHCGPHTYRVRSRTNEHTFYTVIIRRGSEYCSCPDFLERCEPEGEFCKHIHAAKRFSECSGECADCKVRVLHRDLYEVSDEHLTWFEGDELCKECALSAGVR